MLPAAAVVGQGPGHPGSFWSYGYFDGNMTYQMLLRRAQSACKQPRKHAGAVTLRLAAVRWRSRGLRGSCISQDGVECSTRSLTGSTRSHFHLLTTAYPEQTWRPRWVAAQLLSSGEARISQRQPQHDFSELFEEEMVSELEDRSVASAFWAA